MKIGKDVIKLIVYAHENGIDIVELEVADSGAVKSALLKDPKPVRKTKKEMDPDQFSGSISDKEITKMRAFLSLANSTGLLTPNQKSALEATMGTFARNLSYEQKKQIKDIYEEAKG